MTSLRRVVVVGASAAGLTAVETLRREGYEGEVVVVGDETAHPYDRPPLSKQVLAGAWEADRVVLRKDDVIERLDARWVLGTRATGADIQAQQVTLSDGTTLGYDGLVIATGVGPRLLDSGHDLAGVHILRTLDHALALRAELRAAKALVVVGAGFLGAEVASVARDLGLTVTMVDPLEAPMVRQFGPVVGNFLADQHRARGVDVRCSTGVVGLEGRDGKVARVVLTDGTAVDADVVLVAIGSIPAVDWLADSGLSIVNGVECDEFCQAAPGVVAAGDVASWEHPQLGRLRVEHRMNATEQGMAAAKTLLGKGQPFAPVPYFWSDQYDLKLQAYGLPGSHADFQVVTGDPAAGKFAALYSVAGTTIAALSCNLPREARMLRQHVIASQPVDEVVAEIRQAAVAG
ncbi:MAG: FAD-dependent oxidoreductase [Actinomycetota bacterium]|nr:MAG: FAD-dependent oxidoreductase [Actinomycetota bacterium]